MQVGRWILGLPGEGLGSMISACLARRKGRMAGFLPANGLAKGRPDVVSQSFHGWTLLGSSLANGWSRA
jgi:hypothetical protein